MNEQYIGDIPPLNTDQIKVILSQLAKKVCKIYKTKTNTATGFLLKIPYPDQFSLLPVLITNNHFLNKNDLKTMKNIKITFDNDNIEKYIKLNDSRKIYSNDDKDIDITIIEIKNQLEQLNNYLDIDEHIYEDNHNYLNKPIYILQYPKGSQSSYSLGVIKSIVDSNIKHSCSTDFGSSGSPILNLSNFKIVGVHKRGTPFNLNEGTFIKFIIDEFNKEYPKEIDTKSISQNNNNDKTFNSINIVQNEMPIMSNLSSKFMTNDIFGSSNDWGNVYTSYRDLVNLYQKTKAESTKLNVVFRILNGQNINLVFNYGTTISSALWRFLEKMWIPHRSQEIYFLYNAQKINLNDQTPVEKFFWKNHIPQIIVNDVSYLIGANNKCIF